VTLLGIIIILLNGHAVKLTASSMKKFLAVERIRALTT
jgi:hypothetical protein